MKNQYSIYVFTLALLSFTACKKEVSNTEKAPVKKEVMAANLQSVSLNISGMTCEIGCAKMIQSRLSKKEGVNTAKVIFKDSIATVEFDANQVSKKDLIAVVEGIADGELYSASEIKTQK